MNTNNSSPQEGGPSPQESGPKSLVIKLPEHLRLNGTEDSMNSVVISSDEIVAATESGSEENANPTPVETNPEPALVIPSETVFVVPFFDQSVDSDYDERPEAYMTKSERRAKRREDRRNEASISGPELITDEFSGDHNDKNGLGGEETVVKVASEVIDLNKSEEISISLAETLEAQKENEAFIKKQLMEDRNALASLAATRRKDTAVSKRRNKESARRHETLQTRYQESLDKSLETVTSTKRNQAFKDELELLSHAEEAYRSGDQKKIALLFNVNYEKYKEVIAEARIEYDVAEIEKRRWDNTADSVQGHTDKIVYTWSEMSGKKKLLASAGVSALAVASTVALPAGAVVGAAGAAGAGLISTATSAIRKTTTYKLNAGARQKKRNAIIGEVSTTDADVAAMDSSQDVIDVLNSTIESDIQDNNKTLRRVGYAAVAGALLGGTVSKYGGQLAGFAGEKLSDAYDSIFGDNPLDSFIESAAEDAPLPTTPAIGDTMTEAERPALSVEPSMPEPDVQVVEELEVDADVISEAETEVSTPIEEQPEAVEEIDTEVEVPVEDEVVVQPVEEIAPVVETPTETVEPVAETVDTPEEVSVSETITLDEIDNGEGFQKVFKDQYGLDNEQSWNAYQAVKPHLGDQAGVYSMGSGDFGLASADDLQLNSQASAALRSFLETLEDDDELLLETS